ncbi:MAG: YraN family protein [Bdellovibrionales bacterium]|nr:YraN family protein [Bdellovibrionales bacterium]
MNSRHRPNPQISPKISKTFSPSQRVHAGRAAESQAERIFIAENPGARLLCRNFKNKGFELDLVFWVPGKTAQASEWVFVEVRMLSDPRAFQAGMADQSITPKKRAQVEKGARWFLAHTPRPKSVQSIRFSVITLGPGGFHYWPRAWG